MSKNKWVIINSYHQQFEIGVPMSLLESNNIECIMVDVNSGIAMSFNNSITHSVSLAVKTEDVEEAIKILDANNLAHF